MLSMTPQQLAQEARMWVRKIRHRTPALLNRGRFGKSKGQDSSLLREARANVSCGHVQCGDQFIQQAEISQERIAGGFKLGPRAEKRHAAVLQENHLGGLLFL